MKRKRNFSIVFSALVLTIMWLSISLAAPPVLQTQFGPNGMEVDLIRVKISGKVLSVVFAFRNGGSDSANVVYNIGEVYYVDNTESKKYHVLKDAKGAWISGPVAETLVGHKKILTAVHLQKGEKKIVWYKFPLPPENVTHIQILLPDISPFDDVEITR
jgi:hypothetical protein